MRWWLLKSERNKYTNKGLQACRPDQIWLPDDLCWLHPCFWTNAFTLSKFAFWRFKLLDSLENLKNLAMLGHPCHMISNRLKLSSNCSLWTKCALPVYPSPHQSLMSFKIPTQHLPLWWLLLKRKNSSAGSTCHYWGEEIQDSHIQAPGTEVEMLSEEQHDGGY